MSFRKDRKDTNEMKSSSHSDQSQKQKQQNEKTEKSGFKEDLKHCVYSGIVYDTDIVHCHFCGRKLNPKIDSIDEFVPILPNFFLCLRDYKNFIYDKSMKAKIQKPLREAFIQNFISDIFAPPPIPQESVPLHLPYDIFLPTIRFHCTGELEDIQCEKLEKMLGENVFIYDVERGSQAISAAILYDIKWNDFQRAPDDLKNRIAPIFDEVKQNFRPAIEQSLVGDFIDQPIINVPNIENINELARNKATNILQNFRELEEFELNQIINDLIGHARNQRSKQYLRSIVTNKEIYDRAEKQIINDIRSNPYELTITRESLIVNKFDDQYNELKNTINNEEVHECFLYHGTRFRNHYGIINSSFNVPNYDDSAFHDYDDGFYGSGVYSTDNIFYSTLYANGYNHLSPDETAYILYCKAFYNKDFVNEIHEQIGGVPLDPNLLENCGINHVLVGNSVGYNPIREEERERNLVVAGEFVFGRKYQIIPIFSFQVMRRDHLILWKDDHIDNDENSSYMKELLKQGVNIYGVKNNEDAINIIKAKKRNKIKLITNCGEELLGKQLIETIRNEFHYNFICLVFTSRFEYLDWVRTFENVILTTSEEKFKEFISLEMTQENVMRYIRDLESYHHTVFNINESEILYSLIMRRDGLL